MPALHGATVTLLLSDAEIRALTHRDRPKAQARVLTRLGVPFKAHPTDGFLIVSRAACESALGGPRTEAANDESAETWTVDTEAIKTHGQAATAR